MSVHAAFFRQPLAGVQRSFDQVRHAINRVKREFETALLLERSVRTKLDRMGPHWHELNADTLTLGANGKKWATRTLHPTSWPEGNFYAGWPEEVLFPENGDVTVAIHTRRLTRKRSKSDLQGQRAVQTSVVDARARLGIISDPDDDKNLASPTELVDQVSAGNERLWPTTVTFTLRAPNEVALNKLEEYVREELEAKGFVFASTHWAMLNGMWATAVPYLTNLFKLPVRLNTTSLAMSFLYLVRKVGTRTGPFFAVALAGRSPVRLNFWAHRDEPKSRWNNPGFCIITPPGGGKTVTFMHLIARYLVQKIPPQIILIDPVKNDYDRLVKWVGGLIFRFSADAVESEETQWHVNVLDLPPAKVLSGTGEEIIKNPVHEQTRLVTGLIALMVGEVDERGNPIPMRKAIRSAAQTAILAAYHKAGIYVDDKSTWNAGPDDVPVFPDVLAQLELAADKGNQNARLLAEGIQPYCTGMYKDLFIHRTNVKLDSRLISFDLSSLDEDTRGLAVWMIGDHVWKLAKRDRRRRVFCMDEVKRLLRYAESAMLVAEMYTLGRAYRIAPLSATQHLIDYLFSEDGKLALDSADSVLLMRLPKGTARDAQAKWSFSDADREFLESADKGFGLLITPEGVDRVYIPASAFVRWLAGEDQENPGPLTLAAVREELALAAY